MNSSKIGKAGEEQAHWVLNTLFDCVEKIHTSWQIVRWVNRSKGIAEVFPSEKVAGDFTAVEPHTGKSVLIEVKTHKGDRLPYSALTKRRKRRITTQADDLAYHTEAGGRSYLVWNSEAGLYVIQWPIENFNPGSALSLAEAAELSIYEAG